MQVDPSRLPADIFRAIWQTSAAISLGNFAAELLKLSPDFRNFKVKLRRPFTPFNDILLKQIVPQTLFAGGQITVLNLLLFLTKARKFPAVFGLTFLVAWGFIRAFSLNFSPTVSFYIIARVLIALYYKLASENKFTPKPWHMRAVYMLVFGVCNVYIFMFPQYISKRMAKNYENIGGLTKEEQLQFKILSEKQ